MGDANINWAEMTDAGLIAAIGRFIRHTRLSQHKTQQQLAIEAGLNRWTLSQIENGESVNLLSLIQLLRALDKLHIFNSFEVIEEISPLAYAKLKKAKRQRAGTAKKTNENQKEDLGW